MITKFFLFAFIKQKSISSDSESDDSSSTTSANIVEDHATNNGNVPRATKGGNKDQESIHVSMSARFVKRFHNMKGTTGSARTDLSFTPLKQMEVKGTSSTSTSGTTTTTSTVLAKQDKKPKTEMVSDEINISICCLNIALSYCNINILYKSVMIV